VEKTDRPREGERRAAFGRESGMPHRSLDGARIQDRDALSDRICRFLTRTAVAQRPETSGSGYRDGGELGNHLAQKSQPFPIQREPVEADRLEGVEPLSLY
jgi:hypothetical protein